jgi:hypothetical protein
MSVSISTEKTQTLLNKNGNTKPASGSWGIANRDFSSGGFWWFEDLTTLWEFVKYALPAIENDPDDIENFPELFEQHQLLSSGLDIEAPDFNAVLQHHNTYFASDIELVWIGSFDELVKQSTEFAVFVREEFHESVDAIDVKELKDFKQFVGDEVDYLGMFEQ